MNTVVDPIEMSEIHTDADVTSGIPSMVTSSLYDLMAALQAMVPQEDDALVVATMLHLLRSGRLCFVRRQHTKLFRRRDATAMINHTARAGTAA